MSALSQPHTIPPPPFFRFFSFISLRYFWGNSQAVGKPCAPVYSVPLPEPFPLEGELLHTLCYSLTPHGFLHGWECMCSLFSFDPECKETCLWARWCLYISWTETKLIKFHKNYAVARCSGTLHSATALNGVQHLHVGWATTGSYFPLCLQLLQNCPGSTQSHMHMASSFSAWVTFSTDLHHIEPN